MGLRDSSTVYRSIKRGLKCIHYWIEIRTLVTKCALMSPFDWDRFLEEMDILAPKQLDKLLTLLDCKEGELTTPKELSQYFGSYLNSFARDISNLKGVLMTIGIPEDEINRVHPIFPRYQAQELPYLIHKLRGNATHVRSNR